MIYVIIYAAGLLGAFWVGAIWSLGSYKSNRIRRAKYIAQKRDKLKNL